MNTRVRTWTCTIMIHDVCTHWWVCLMRLGLHNQEVFKLRRMYKHLSGGGAKPRNVKIGLGKIIFERRLPRPIGIVSLSRFSMILVASSVVSPAVVVVPAIVGPGRRCRPGRTVRGPGADIIALISILRFFGPSAGNGTDRDYNAFLRNDGCHSGCCQP